MVLHLGDDLYEGASSGGGVRRHLGPEPTTLDGYRARLLRCFDRRRSANPVVLGGGIHSFFVNDLKLDNRHEHVPVLATELDSVTRRDAGVRTLARFVVEGGHPGAHRLH